MKSWISVGGVKCPCRLTATQIVYTVADGEQVRFGRKQPWSGEGRMRTNLNNHNYRSVTIHADGWPKGGAAYAGFSLDRPEAWPACSDDVRAWLQWNADVARQRAMAEAEANRRSQEKRRRDYAVASAAGALLDAAKTGDAGAILAAAKAYADVAKGVS